MKVVNIPGDFSIIFRENTIINVDQPANAGSKIFMLPSTATHFYTP